MDAKTKHYLIVGGALIIASIIGVVFYRRYQGTASASQGAADQQNADALAYLEASSMSDPYGFSGGGGGGGGISIPSISAQSLADEVKSIEAAFGLGPAPAPAPAPSPSGTGATAPAPAPVHTLPAQRGVPSSPSPRVSGPIFAESPVMKLEHEAFMGAVE